jgi:hypothetical protein
MKEVPRLFQRAARSSSSSSGAWTRRARRKEAECDFQIVSPVALGAFQEDRAEIAELGCRVRGAPVLSLADLAEKGGGDSPELWVLFRIEDRERGLEVGDGGVEIARPQVAQPVEITETQLLWAAARDSGVRSGKARAVS